jgi:hypothetical protein
MEWREVFNRFAAAILSAIAGGLITAYFLHH